ncbi:CoA transferase [Saccharopolyspora sp. WRP15-2]|uniref:CoA transferase n=1 Tax=Saccharopolyspora oryzae TaxID=2997343 RepID=A0ABT4V302_9PSEU|nr:CoA transferase [Saccharopolyspora oryzae]MDA3627796.1 CoA transferase [Saccharopolyspora oryzae]
MTAEWRRPLAEALDALGIDRSPDELAVTGELGHLPSRLAVEEIAIASIGAALLAAGPAELATEHAAAAVRSEAHLRLDGRPPLDGFAPLSRFWRTSDGWVRTHGNYPWHREALLRALGATDDVEVEPAIAELPALEAESRVVAAGGIAAAVRSPAQWRAEAPGRAVDAQPLVGTRHVDGAAPRRGRLRVLDLTRVIAGPVCTRFLAALGADVLRIDPPHRPERPGSYDTLLGKRSAVLDARTPEGLARLHDLLDGADVLVHGYRPGALERFGLGFDALAEQHPGLVVVSLSAWGNSGPWGERRGFDSIAQAATGIATIESTSDGPGALPCQLLDHATGYLCAAAALDGLRRQSERGGTWLRELSLARTAHWLLDRPRTEHPPLAAAVDPWLTSLNTPDGRITTVTPPGRPNEQALSWPFLHPYGSAAPAWSREHFGLL